MAGLRFIFTGNPDPERESGLSCKDLLKGRERFNGFLFLLSSGCYNACMTLPTTFYPWLALIIGVLAIAWLVRGWKRGLLYSLLDILSMLASLVLGWGLAWILAQLFPITEWISKYAVLSPWQMQVVNQIFWFAASFLVLKIVFRFLYGIAGWLKRIQIVSWADHLFGLVFSAISAFFALMVLSLFLQLPIIQGGAEFVNTSYLHLFAQAADRLCAGAMDGSLQLDQINQLIYPGGK